MRERIDKDFRGKTIGGGTLARIAIPGTFLTTRAYLQNAYRKRIIARPAKLDTQQVDEGHS